MTSELVSIVIPVYNSEKYLEECLDSVISQTYQNIEIIAVDDGSTDSSPEILKKYSDNVIVLSQKNGGLASALNFGISKINGYWFKWFSPDDVMFPYTIETLVDAAKKYSDIIIYSNWEIIDEKGKKLREFYESNYNELSNFEYNVRLLDGQQINVNTTLIPSSLFEKCNIQKLDDPVAIDYDFFLRSAILYHAEFHLLENSLIKYRIHSNQLSHTNISQTLDYLNKVRDNILSSLDLSKKQKYLKKLDEYNKSKSFSMKIKDLGLNMVSNYLPDSVSDNILTFYLNKIRASR
jgi:glycosyltransferase involved in cell wall biosynthesis